MKYSKTMLMFTLLFVSNVSQAATFYADTNGDGVTDTITSVATSANSYVQIYHPNMGTTSYYNFGSGLTSFGMVGTTDTNGQAGQEVVIRATSTFNSMVYTINDARQTTQRYDFGTGLANFSIIGISNNTDGFSGNEIIVRTDSSGSIPATSLSVIDDRRAVKRQYNFGTGLSSIKVVSITDTNGLTGDEIVMQLESSGGIRTVAIQIIDDAKVTTRQYDQSSNLTSFSVLGVRNYDGVAGAEVCYRASTSTYTYYQMIVDRTGSVVSRSSC